MCAHMHIEDMHLLHVPYILQATLVLAWDKLCSSTVGGGAVCMFGLLYVMQPPGQQQLEHA